MSKHTYEELVELAHTHPEQVMAAAGWAHLRALALWMNATGGRASAKEWTRQINFLIRAYGMDNTMAAASLISKSLRNEGLMR